MLRKNNQNLNILYIHPWNHSGGPDNFLYYLVSSLRKLGYKYFIIVSSYRDDFEKFSTLGEVYPFPGIRMLHKSYNPFKIIRFCFDTIKTSIQLSRFVKVNNIDLIHCGTILSINGLLLAILTKKRLIYHIQDLGFSKYKLIGKFLAIIINKYADIIVGISNACCENFSKYLNSSSKCKVVHNGIDLNKFLSIDRTIYPEYNIGMISSIDHRKAQDRFVKIAKEVYREHRNCRFFIYGDIINFNGGGAKFYEYVKTLGNELLQKKVLYIFNHIPYSRISLILELMDIIVVPSRTEGLSLIAIEAAAAGLPVVAANIEGLKEVVKNERTGFLVEEDNIFQYAYHIKKLVNDEKLYNYISVNARRSVRSKFNLEKFSYKMHQIYQTLLKE